MNKEYLQIKLDYLKSLIVTFLVSLLGIFGYVALHYKEIEFMLWILIAVGITLLCIMLYFLNKTFYKQLDKLGRIEK